MALQQRAKESEWSVDLAELSIELAKLDPTKPHVLGQRLVSTLAEGLHTDRVSLLLIDPHCPAITGAFFTGFPAEPRAWNESTKIIEMLCHERQPLVFPDIHQHPHLLAPWASRYKTDACAVFPLMHGRRLLGALCLSNLSSRHLTLLEASAAQLDLIIAQTRQFVLLLQAAQVGEEAEGPVTSDELTLLGTLIERLDRTMDTRNVFGIFTEMVSGYLPLDLLAVVHDRMYGPHGGVVCVQRPVHYDEVEKLFASLSHQWQRRHRRAPILQLRDVEIIGRELVQESGPCPDELRVGCTETIPVFIDNDLFALVCLAASEGALADPRRLRVFSILAHHLLLHVKKALLMVQNQEMQTVDALTGLYNERHFYQMMEREFDRAARYNVPLTLLFIDVDHFKDVNETYGYETGDLLLQEISRIIMENMRSTDFVSRYSGERFVVVLPETHYKNSDIMANRLRRFIENNSFFIPNTNVFIKVTVSVGIASYLDHKPASLAQFIEFADTALYFAKRMGRNQAVGYTYVINMMMGETDHHS